LGAFLHVLAWLKLFKIQSQWILDSKCLLLFVICLPVAGKSNLPCSKDCQTAIRSRVICPENCQCRFDVPECNLKSLNDKCKGRDIFRGNFFYLCLLFNDPLFLHFYKIFIADLLWKRFQNFNHIFRRSS
jgi:hypothetical protein